MRCAVLCAAVLLPLVAASGAVAGRETDDPPYHGHWYSFRVDTRGMTWLSLDLATEFCTGRSVSAMGVFVLGDGALWSSKAIHRWESWHPLRDNAHVAAAGATARPHADGPPLCSDWTYPAVDGALDGVSAVTVTLFMAVDRSTASATVRSPAGAPVVAASGPLIALTKAELARTAYASAYPLTVGVSGGAGAGSFRLASDDGLLGWFIPREPGSVGVTSAECTLDGEACATDRGGVSWFARPERSVLDVRLRHDARADQGDYYALVVKQGSF